jgi:ElaB/YqjD/DUF883 family membrane-anchored ribosome-binding protein
MVDKKIDLTAWPQWLKNRRFWKIIIFTVVGMILGYLYYFYVGCQSGTCPITSNPYGSVAVGGIMGFLLSK